MARELPWFSWAAIRFLNDWLLPTHSVIEFGGGGSTLFFAKRAAKVLTVETDPGWRTKLQSVAPPNVTFVSETPDERERADLIVVDGPDDLAKPRLRVDALTWALRHLNPGGRVVLDDSWAYRDFLPPNSTIFIGIGPCRLVVTETAVIRQ